MMKKLRILTSIIAVLIFASCCSPKKDIQQPESAPQSTSEPVEIVEPEPVEIVEPEPVEIVEPEPVEIAEPEPVEIVEPEPVEIAEPEPVEIVEPEPVEIVEPEPVEIAEPEPVEIAEPEPIEKPQQPEPDEYSRAISALSAEDSVSEDTFTEDKKEIMHIIDELSDIMKNKDFSKWVKYLTPASRNYWSNPANLREVSKKLPLKGFTLKNLEDYFKYVFIPSRQGRRIDEIRYLSSSYVKAVQVKNNTDIIFYYFNKIDGKWLLNINP